MNRESLSVPRGLGRGLKFGHERSRAAAVVQALLRHVIPIALIFFPAPSWGQRSLVSYAPGQVVVRYRPGVLEDVVGSPQSSDLRSSGRRRTDRPASLEALDESHGLLFALRMGVGEVEPRLGPGMSRDAASRLSRRARRPPLINASRPTARIVAAIEVLHFADDADVEAIAAAYGADPNVLTAEPNYFYRLTSTPNDEFFASQIADFDQVRFREAWDIQTGDPGVVVAILDSGADTDHEDLAGAISPLAFDFVDDETDVTDDQGHGTRVAALIGAMGDNQIGMAGGAYGVTLLPLDIAGPDGGILNSDVIEAIDYAVAQGADVLNMSFTAAARSELLAQAIAAASRSAVLVAAVGNEGRDDVMRFPAALEGVIGVAAARDGSLERALFSNFNGPAVAMTDLAAPGETLFSAIPGDQYEGASGSGTSFAASLVSAAAALLKSRNPDQSPAAIAGHLLAHSAPLGEPYAAHGFLDAAAPLAATMVPRLVVDSVTVLDPSGADLGNDGNGSLGNGETVSLLVTLRNEGGDAAGVAGTLSTSDPLVTLGGTTSAEWGTILSGAAVQNTGSPFVQVTAAVAGDARDAAFSLDLTANLGAHAQTLDFTLRIENFFEPPAIIAADTTWTADKTYLITRNTVVIQGVTLTIEPGTTIKFAKTQSRANALEIRGGIEALGTAENEILFTSLDRRPSGGLDPEFRLSVGRSPRSVAIGDADNDGDNDIVTANGGGDVSLIRWNGTGFDEEVRLPVESSLSAVAIGDADNDGDNDIVTADRNSNDVLLFRWNGTGFDSEVRLAVGSEPRSVAIGDADNDGDNDIVTANTLSDDVSLIRWNGTGFDAEIRLPVGSEPYAVAIGDADNDGDNDIVTANVGSHDASLIRWNGTGFDAQVRLPVGNVPTSVAIGDADSDGDNDIVTANGEGHVSFIGWNGAGFDSEVRLPVGSQPMSVVIGDTDNDGDNEIVTANCDSSDLSLIDWNGTEFEAEVRVPVSSFPCSVAIGDADNDGDIDIVTGNSSRADVSLFRWNAELAERRTNGGLWLKSTVSSASFTNSRFEFTAVLDESAVASFADCVFDRTGGDFALYSIGGNDPIERCQFIGNGGGDGLRAGAKSVIDCLAQGNAGIGLQGGDIQGSEARGNGGDGMVGAGAQDCVATHNGAIGIRVTGAVTNSVASGNLDWGISTPGNVTASSAIGNSRGIRCGNVSDSSAETNAGAGIESSGTASNSSAIENGAIGITAIAVLDSTVVGNATGLVSATTVERSYVAGNAGPGVTGGAVRSSVVLAHRSGGVVDADSVEDSWIVRNEGAGVSTTGAVAASAILENLGPGIIGAPGSQFTTIADSLIRGNSGSGVVSAGPMTGSALFGNGRDAGFDYEETRLSTLLLVTNLSGNYWGPETTPLMDANPWDGTRFFNVPRIHDFVDDTLLTEVNYSGHLSSDPGTGPDDSAPGFLLSVSPRIREPINAGVRRFVFDFSEPMDTTATPTVTFDVETPFTLNVVGAFPGWIGDRTWAGEFAVDSTTGDGTHTLRVSGATDLTGFVIPDDAYHKFVIDTSGALVANNGSVRALEDRAELSWDAGSATDTIGFNVVRSTTGQPGSYREVNGPLVPDPGAGAIVMFTDGPLAGNTLFFWKIYRVTVSGESEIWSGPLSARTPGEETPTPTPTATPTPTPTTTATPTPTMTATPPPTGQPEVGFCVTASSVEETAGSVAICVELNGPSAQMAQVSYRLTTGGTATSGSDFILQDGTLVFAAGTVSQSIPIVLLIDTMIEGNETVALELFSPVGATIDPVRGAHVLTIVDATAEPAGLRINRWVVRPNDRTPANGRVIVGGEFNDQSMQVELDSGGDLLFAYDGATVTDALTSPGFTRRRGAKYRYRDSTRRGTFLHRIGGSSRTKFSFRSKQDVSALAAIALMRVSMTSDGFSGEVSLVPTLTARGSSFKIARDAYTEPELYVDSLLVKRFPLARPDRDSVRLTARFPGAPNFLPESDTLVVDLGFFRIVVAPNDWTRNRAGTKFTHTTQAGVSRITIKVNQARRTISLKGKKLTLPGPDAATPDASIALGFGDFAEVNAVNLQVKTTGSGTEIFRY